MAPSKPKKVPKRIARIILACRRGETITKTYISPRDLTDAPAPIYRLEPSGRLLPRISAEQAIERGIAVGWLVAGSDGLFGDSQTWRAT